MASLVLDTSVVGRWFLNDEDLRPQALRLRESIIDGSIDPIAPPHMPTELASALVRAVRAGRLESDVVRPALEALETFAIETADLPGLAADAADLALELRLHPADTAFLALALRRSINIVTADRRLHEGASAAGYEVIWLADLPV